MSKGKWIKMARSAKTPIEVKAVMEAIDEAMSLKQNKHLTKEMNEALDILVGMDTSSVFENDDISLEFLKEQELEDRT